MKSKLLLVEDSDYKRGKILDFLTLNFPNVEVTVARSHSSGMAAIDEQGGFQVLLLDVSLPTYDKSATESGGRFRTYGGREIARRAIKRVGPISIAFITQYKTFNDKGASLTYDELCGQLENDCGSSFLGAIFFDGSASSWKESLLDILKGKIQ